MSDSTSNVKQSITEQEHAVFMASLRIGNGFLTTIQFQADKATETIDHLRPYFEATSQSQPDEKTIYQVLNALAQRLAIMDQLIESIEDNNALTQAVGYPLDRATAMIELLRAYFAPSCPMQPDDKTVYHALSSVLLELVTMQKAINEYKKVNDQA